MSEKQERVLSFLRKNRTNEDLIEIVRKETAPYYAIAESDQYPLLPEEKRDKDQIMKAVALATGQKVTGVEFVSLSCPSPKQGWMSQEFHRHMYINSFKYGILRDANTLNFRHRLNVSCGLELQNSIDLSIERDLGQGLKNSIKESLMIILTKTLGKNDDEHLWESHGWAFTHTSYASSPKYHLWCGLKNCIMDNLMVCLCHYHTAAIKNDREKVEQLTPLIREHAISMPGLIFKKGEPSVPIFPST
jgi:hypothetical protein